MKVLAINSSPRMEKGNTALILNPFLEGMKRGQSRGRTILYFQKLNINPCTGEFNCWLKTPGKCYQDDDMKILYPRIDEADVMVFATPVYVDRVIQGLMKNMIDRMIPRKYSLSLRCAMGIVVTQSVETAAPSNLCWSPTVVSGKRTILTLCLFSCKHFARMHPRNLQGHFSRPHGEAMAEMLKMGAPIGDIFEAAKKSRHPFCKMWEKKILSIVSRKLLPKEMYVQIINRSYPSKL